MDLIEATVIAFKGDFMPWTFCILAIVIFPLSRKLQSLYVGATARRVILLLTFFIYVPLGLLISNFLNLSVHAQEAEKERIRLMKKPLEDLIVCYLEGRSEEIEFESVKYILCDGQVYNASTKKMATEERSLEVLKSIIR